MHVSSQHYIDNILDFRMIPYTRVLTKMDIKIVYDDV